MQPAGKTRVTPNGVNVYLKPETCYLLRPGERGPRRTRVKHGDGDTPSPTASWGLRDRSLITERGRGALQNGREVLPL